MILYLALGCPGAPKGSFEPRKFPTHAFYFQRPDDLSAYAEAMAWGHKHQCPMVWLFASDSEGRPTDQVHLDYDRWGDRFTYRTGLGDQS